MSINGSVHSIKRFKLYTNSSVNLNSQCAKHPETLPSCVWSFHLSSSAAVPFSSSKSQLSRVCLFQGNSHNKRDALLMYEQQLAKLSCPVTYRKEGVFVPSYYEKYPLIHHPNAVGALLYT